MDRTIVGIQGFDELVEGGLPKNTVSLVAGPSGAGKSLFSLHFVYNGAKVHNENSLYLTVEERASSLRRAIKGYGMNIDELENQGKLALLDLAAIRKHYESKEEEQLGIISFDSLKSTIEAYLSNHDIKRIVLDSLTAVCVSYPDQTRLRSELFRFTNFLREMDTTSLLVSEKLGAGGITSDMEPFLTDSYIMLDLEKVKGELRRTITVRKMRFTQHDTSTHPFLIMKKGMMVLSDEKIY